jgi:N,N'-diacetyllegionaminate synthase
VKIGNLDTRDKVMIVAEIGNNHEGSVELGRQLVDKAADAGVDAVKFQTFKTETFVSPSDVDRFNRMKGFELTTENFEELAIRARNNGLLFISTPLDMPSATFLIKIVDALKIASGDNTFYPLIELVSKSDKPIILSTGFADEEQIKFSASFIKNNRPMRTSYSGLALLHCVSAYPVNPFDANLSAIRTLAEKFPSTTIGYSDHTIGNEAAILAVAAGARIIEKHFTIDRNYSEFRDHQLSADPTSMAELVTKIRDTEILLGTGSLDPREIERDTEPPVRRSIAAARNIEAGDTIVYNDIMWIRPGNGFRPGLEHQVLGKTLKNSIQIGELFSNEHFS